MRKIQELIALLVTHREKLARAAFFIIYFWFGILKVLGLSPATGLVHTLFDATLAWLLPFDTFYLLFSLLEVAIGIAFLFPKYTKYTLIVFFLHMGMTLLPLVFTPNEVWQSFAVPSLEGQYIIKNLALIMLAVYLIPQRKK